MTQPEKIGQNSNVFEMTLKMRLNNLNIEHNKTAVSDIAIAYQKSLVTILFLSMSKFGMSLSFATASL